MSRFHVVTNEFTKEYWVIQETTKTDGSKETDIFYPAQFKELFKNMEDAEKAGYKPRID